MRISFGIQIALALFLLAGATTGLSLYYFYERSSELVLDQMRTRMRDLGNAGALLFRPADREAIVRLSREAAERAQSFDADARLELENEEYWESLSVDDAEKLHRSEDFQQVVQLLRKIKAGSLENSMPYRRFEQSASDPVNNSRVKYAYLVVAIPGYPSDQAVSFLADSDYLEVDLNDNGEIDEDEEANPIGNYWHGDEPIFKQAFRGVSGSAREWYADRWGTWLSSATPIFDDRGRVIAVLGLDLDVSGEANRLNSLRGELWVLLGITLVIALLVAVGLARFLHRPVEALRLGAERVRARDFDTFIVVRRKDELGLLARTFNEMVTEIRGYARELEQKVAERTTRLEESLSEVRQLKDQQDGDYYLTNLLADPLFKDWNTSKRVRTEFLIQQKKQFRFRNRSGELGGDLCVTGNLRLAGRPYVMFFNADAMGKSMQGAGGALVAGTVINSIMQRSGSSGAKAGPTYEWKTRSETPEEWLTATFRELHGVLSSFDGSMAVSCVLGLIDENTGLMHWFNAEHPFPILYRDGACTFLSEETKLYKLGMPQSLDEEAGFVDQYQFESGDVLIIGSDGKDDLRVSDEGGEDYIRHDEERILGICEVARGELAGIVDGVEAAGEITDDLSLVRIVFDPAHSMAASSAKPDGSTQVIAKLLRGRKYEKALAEVESASRAGRISSMLANYYRGLCLSKLGRQAEALQHLEQAAELNRTQSVVPELLGQVYLKLGQPEEARYHWERALQLKPDNDRLRDALARLRAADGTG